MSAAAGDDRSRLLRALALSRRFHLFLAYCASPRAADQLLHKLGEELPRLRKQAVELVQLDPYEGRESYAPLSDAELADRILIPLLAPSEERKAHGVVHVVDASRATHADTDAWGRLFALWNEKRNALQQLGGEALVLLPEELKRLFATAAPDVWSIRSGEYTIDEETSGLESMSERGSPFAQRGEALGWYRSLPPLALFGGDLLVKPWMKDIVLEARVDKISSEPFTRGSSVADKSTLVQRELRRGEHALGQRDFRAAHSLFRQIVEDPATDIRPENRHRAVTALIFVLAAKDRAKEAFALRESVRALAPWPVESMDRLLQADAYLSWCAGRLRLADSVDKRRAGTPRAIEDEQSWLLRSVEQGEITDEIRWFAPAATPETDDPSRELNSTLVCADYYFLTGRLKDSSSLLGPPWIDRMHANLHNDDIALARRAHTLTALVELARGNRSRAIHLLSPPSPEISHAGEPEMSGRVSAFRAFVLGLLQAQEHNPAGAVTWLTRARGYIAEWSRTGFDRRSLHRASLAVDLAHATVDPAPIDPVGVARQLVQRAVLLLGDTAEDFIARVLAVEARRELARRLVDRGDDEAVAEAHRALDLARPLAGRGVPAWDAMLAATEREAATLATT